MRGGDMTDSSELDRGVAAAIRALRHDILSRGRDLPWDDVRGWIKALIRYARPSPKERIQLLELYDRAAGMTHRRLLADPEGSRRLAYQRANDTIVFLLAELRDQGAVSPGGFAGLLAREMEAGRLHINDALLNVISWVLRESDDRKGPMPPGVAEESVEPSFASGAPAPCLSGSVPSVP
jgi:hypothetical protein